MATHTPPKGAQAAWLAVQSRVQRPLPTPPRSTAEKLSVDRLQVRPLPQSASAPHAAPSLFAPTTPPPLPPVPVAPPAPPEPTVVPLVVTPLPLPAVPVAPVTSVPVVPVAVVEPPSEGVPVELLLLQPMA